MSKFATSKVRSDVAVTVLNSLVLTAEQAAALSWFSVVHHFALQANLHYSKAKQHHETNFDVSLQLQTPENQNRIQGKCQIKNSSKT